MTPLVLLAGPAGIGLMKISGLYYIDSTNNTEGGDGERTGEGEQGDSGEG